MSWLNQYFNGVKTVINPLGSALPQLPSLQFANGTVQNVAGVTVYTAPTASSGSGQYTTALVNGLNSNVPTNGLGSLRMGGYTGPVSLGGLEPAVGGSWAAGQPQDATFIVAGQQVTIVNEDTSSTATNRITTGTGGDVILPPGQAQQARFIYDGTTNRLKFQVSGPQQPIFHVKNFGCKVDGVTDDAVAFLACLAAAAAAGGEVVLAWGLMILGQTITLPSHVRIRGQVSQSADRATIGLGSQISFTGTGDGFLIPDGAFRVDVSNVMIYSQQGAGGGPAVHFAAGAGSGDHHWEHISVQQGAAGQEAFLFGTSGATGAAGGCGLENSTFEHITIQASALGQTKPMIAMYGANGGMNTITWSHVKLNGPGITGVGGEVSPTAPQIRVENVDGTGTTLINFDHVTHEQPLAGAAHFYSCSQCELDTVVDADLGATAPTAPIYKFARSSHNSGLACSNNVLRNVQSTADGALGIANLQYSYADGDITIESCSLPYVDNTGGTSWPAIGTQLIGVGSVVGAFNGYNRPIGLSSGASGATMFWQSSDSCILAAGAHNTIASTNFELPGYVLITGPTGDFSFDGFQGNNPSTTSNIDGQEVILLNTVAKVMTVVDASSSSSVAQNKILCLNGGLNVSIPGPGWARLKWSVDEGCWFLAGTSAPPPSFVVTLANGVNADIPNPGTDTWYVSGPTGAFSIAGIVAGFDNQKLTIINPTAYAMTIKNQDSSDEATAANRLWTPSNADHVYTPASSGFSYVSMVYMGARSGLNRWVTSS